LLVTQFLFFSIVCFTFLIIYLFSYQ
jgi:hypothetical protein